MKSFFSVVTVCAGAFLLLLSGAEAGAFAQSNKDSLPQVIVPPASERSNRMAEPPTVEFDKSIEDSGYPLYKMNKAVKEKLKLSDGERSNFKTALNDSKANIVRMLSAYSCSTAQVIDLRDPRCAEDPYFFIAAYYSFRYKDYGENRWTDLALIEEEFVAGNKWNTIGMIIDLGENADFGKLDENSKEVAALWQMPSAETVDEKTEHKVKLDKGFTYNDLFVTGKAKLQTGHTYLLRTIAYRSEGSFAMFRSSFNWYNTDTLCVFKALGFDQQRTATIGWKRLMQRVAPILKDRDKGDKDRDKEKGQ